MDVQAQEIGKMDPCPCESGKNYGECCAKLGIRYAQFNLGTKTIVFNVEEADRGIQDLLGFIADEVSEPFSPGPAINLDLALSRLETTFQLFEKSLAPFAKASSCQKGCNACCHHLIETTPIEAEGVRRFVENTFSDSEKKKLLEKIDKYRVNYPGFLNLDGEYDEEMLDAYFEKRVPCPFLSAENACMVYPVRPLVCRTYMVFSDPQQCLVGDGMAVYQADYLPDVHRASQFLSLLTFKHIKIRRHLPDWFVNELKISIGS